MRAPSTFSHRLAVLSAGIFVALGVFCWMNLETKDARAALVPSVGTEYLGHDTLRPVTSSKKTSTQATISAPAQLSAFEAGSVSVRSELGVPDALKADID